MFEAYLDASGTEHDQPVLAVAGFIGLAEEWLAFERIWRKRLSKDGFECFHMREINRTFKGRGAARRGLLLDLAAIIEGHVTRKVGCCVVNEGIRQMPAVDKKRWHVNAYSLGGRSCAAQIRLWAETKGARSLPRFVFEEGDAGRGELIKILKRDGFQSPTFDPKKDREKNGCVVRGCVPLQASDLFAYAVFEPARKIEAAGDLEELPWLLDAFRKIPGVVRHLGVKDMVHLRSRLEEPELL